MPLRDYWDCPIFGLFTVGFGTDQRGNFVAQALWKAEPASCVPRLNQVVSPFLGDHFGNSIRSGHQRLLRSGESLEMPHEVSGGGPSGS
jgi:hypothetical protein